MTSSLKEQVQKGSDAVRALRTKRLNQGLPFMINVKGMDNATCYLEYPDGSIHLVRQAPNGTDFETIYVLSVAESKKLKEKLKLVDA
ncbi:hypothetical protein JHJ32_12500 [Parapedobacter sp. ISTM3]|uniref:Uncharacterized protein n=1 Tax=Parapedobacter luteus TaxID=623280 RepID=A0A1T5DU24_9SPHI|nr:MULTISPECIES: hypothetical protein [Parapedobacter]MBK1440812.1 hypothetical protein [Parapedobacter sp. ISTM3]SKB75030.1 hypothetical protein SAMN05660226_02979 [Parapedobacter luteus]